MVDNDTSNLGRNPKEPSPQTVAESMEVCRPYTVGDLTDQFDASRWTIQRRLESLVEEGEIEKRKHAENRVSYWIPTD